MRVSGTGTVERDTGQDAGKRWRLGPWPASFGLALAGLSVMAGAAGAQTSCTTGNTVTADVVAIDQAVQFNRYGSHHPAYMIYALRDDVVSKSGGTSLSPGNVMLRPGKRPRPLVLRVNAGDCLTINFQNLLNATPVQDPKVSVDQPATRQAGLHVAGLNYATGAADDGGFVGANATSLANPGGTRTYRLIASREGVFSFYNPAVMVGGESNIGSFAFGMFGAVAVQPKGAEWYRSQVSRADLDLATRKDANGRPANLIVDGVDTGYPDIDYLARYPANHPVPGLRNRPILAMRDGNKLVHGDINAIITGPSRGRFPEGTFTANPVLEPNRTVPQAASADGGTPETRDRRDPYREFVIQFHDEIKAIQAFAEFEDEELGHTLHSVRDGFGVNYGVTGAGAQVLANRLGVGPTAQCAECKYEEFFLTSWAGGDPALLVDVPANAQLDDSGRARDPNAPRSQRALYPEDPSNVFSSYLNDRVIMRNTHVGKEQHIFHLHAHQWLYNPDQPNSSYLDSQLIAPGSGYTYEIAFNGSGNRNQAVGDSIFHCHLYPHFAQGMWGMWRVHDTFERGTELDSRGVALPTARALPDGEIMAGTAIPAIVPIPGMALAPLPAPVRIANGQAVFDAAPASAEEATAAANPGYPFFVAGQAGHRPPQPPLDMAHDGGLRRHVVVGGEATAQLDRWDLDKVSDKLEIRWLDSAGEPVERAAMAFHAQRAHPSYALTGGSGVRATRRNFITNGRPPVAGAPYADPCMLDDGRPAPGAANPRRYKVAATQVDLVMNRVGWHFRQGRILALWEDVMPTLNRQRAPEPLVMRATSGECIEVHHTNLLPSVNELDDFQVRTPTDIVGQHIHLVKFDVTSADGSGNGWNYEDGTLAPAEVRERIHAIRANYGCETAAGASNPNNCPEAKPHPFAAFQRPEWLGAQTTIQRWYADPVVNQSGQDNTLRTVFTHDHFGPSTHQQNGLYAALVVAPAGTNWTHPETGAALNPRSGGREDGGPTSWMADVRTANPANSYREFVLQVADFANAYEAGGGNTGPDPARAINPPARARIGLPYLMGKEQVCPGGGPAPCPEAVSAADTGTFVVNYRNEPLALRLYNPNTRAQAAGKAGDPSYAFRSDVTRAMTQFNSQPNTYPALTRGLAAGDPWTPMLRAYRRDRVQVRMMVGAHEEAHTVQFSGLRWLFNQHDPNSGWRASNMQAISEHFEFDMPVVAPEGDLGPHTDHLYSVSASADGFWNGAWGLMRAYEYARSDLRPLPNNTPPAPVTQTISTGETVQLGTTATVRNLTRFNGVCPVDAPVRRYAVSAVAASQAIAPTGIIYNPRAGNFAAQRGPITDPTGALYVLDSDLNAGKLRPEAPVEPLVLRANAGDCIEVTLTNRLPANWADQVVSAANQGFNALPMLIERFNANQVKPSMEVGLNPQLLAVDVTRHDGQNIGLNLVPPRAVRPVRQTVAVGQSTTYRWYAGLVNMDATNNLTAVPVEFGAINLLPSDRLRHSGKGLVAGMVILPQGSTWVTDANTRTAATVTMPDGRQFRDFALMFQNDLNLRASNKPVCPVGAGEAAVDTGTPQSVTTTGCKGLDDPEDSGNAGLNYRAEPMWLRVGHAPGENFELTRRLNFSNALSNSRVGGVDPATPVFTARAGQEMRFRLLMAGGHPRPGVFTLHGHNWSLTPYASGVTAAGVVPSQRIEGVRGKPGYAPSMGTGARDAIGPGMHHNVVVEAAGGPAKAAGDYLFRTQSPDVFDSGVWGILRVTP
ncbi:cupredoxin domain-containing protein [Muricoccus pecuniae]|uniref:Multicopper oxidase n=1 Tax=Muricoccus pecuniae TaxID=693023 RepID=A0A840XWD0_9PROT|nr:multicopper oxidase domain-containing protein [Roseomonas pecuniae]MBB5693068.1 hypothetical protein [Roseomonas pecuniae]